jgi:lysophospholipase L1-like esterase
MGRTGRRVLSGVGVGMLAVGAVTFGAVWQPPAGLAAARPASTVHDYLALGDSVTFGYRESNTTPPPNYLVASSFIGYPKDVGLALGLQVANASCPGETSRSLTTKGVQSNGCENVPGGGPGYRSVFPLHVGYKGTQLAFALAYLKAHPSTQLVSLMIGANDAFLCQETTKDNCASELPGVLKQISTNVAKTLSSIRTTARYKGQIVILNYYSLNYSNATDNTGSMTLNTTVDKAAKPYNVTIADGYGAFKAAAAQSGGDSCKAGLLTQLTSTGCGVHPSLAGQAVLALAVEEVVKK